MSSIPDNRKNLKEEQDIEYKEETEQEELLSDEISDDSTETHSKTDTTSKPDLILIPLKMI